MTHYLSDLDRGTVRRYDTELSLNKEIQKMAGDQNLPGVDTGALQVFRVEMVFVKRKMSAIDKVKNEWTR